MLTFHCPYPPSVNSIYRTFRNRIIISKLGREYIEDCIRGLKYQMSIKEIQFPLTSKLRVRYDVHCPDGRRRDLANLDKVLSDCFTKAGVWTDDFNIDDLRFVRGSIDREFPCIVATIEELK